MISRMKYFQIFMLWLVAMAHTSCLKQKPETPNTNANGDPALAVNFTLAQLNSMLPQEGSCIAIDSDYTIAVTVRADDKTGNFNEQIIVEDSSAGIAFMLNESSLFTRYPIGRKLYIRLKGLFLGNYYGTAQLGATPIPDNAGGLKVSSLIPKLFNEHIVTANLVVPALALKFSLADLRIPRPDLCNRLIMIDGIEFENPIFDNAYTEGNTTTSVRMRDCAANTISLRSSNYASFASASLPFGRGSIQAIYSIYKGAGQLILRDTNDVQMNGARCDGSIASEPALISIDSLRKSYKGQDTVIGNYHITAVVTSSTIHKNFGEGNLVMQDNSGAGIVVYFGNSASALPDMGDSILLQLTGATLTSYNGTLELKNIKAAKATILASGKTVQAVPLTIATLNANFAKYESVLVRIYNAKITSVGNFGGNKTLSDATGNTILYTSTTATFASDPVPNITKTFQGIPTYFGTTQELKIRHPTWDIY